MNAPYTGGSSPGDQLFMVDGDFSLCDPCGPPVFSYPLKGDSIFSNRDVFYYDMNYGGFLIAPFGTFPNIQPWSANQTAIVLEQEFMVAQQYYYPMRLNSPYYYPWSLGWQGQFPDGANTVPLDGFYLVEEGELQDAGAGIVKIKRKWATIPQTRNEVEQYTYNFIGFGDTSTSTTRSRTPIVVQSRLQYDYYIFDDLDILGLALFPDGNRLNASTGLSPANFILPEQYYFANSDGVAQNIFVDAIDDGGSEDSSSTTVPGFTEYVNLIQGVATSNSLAAEIIAEGSVLTRYMGNIWERRTRFVIAQ